MADLLAVVCGFILLTSNGRVASFSIGGIPLITHDARERTRHHQPCHRCRHQIKNDRQRNVLVFESEVGGDGSIDELESAEASVNESAEASVNESRTTISEVKASKREMMRFAAPALGIFLTNPLLSNIDNAFVGKTTGTAGLAALSPATICTDQILYLFSFLSRATTGLVSRAYGADNDGKNGNVDAAREAASAPLTVSLICGVILSILYAFLTPAMLSGMNVDPSLRRNAASYVYWRGAIAWAALAQACSLQVMLATRDAVTPLVIVAAAALFNIVGDALFCAWPFRWGCAGAAAATSLATLLSSGLMLVALKRKQLLPSLRLPKRNDLTSLLDFTGPLLAITATRLIGFVAMQKRAMTLGVEPLAAYQLCINVIMFFLLFGEPLSQLSQTKLPPLVDAQDGDAILANLKSILILGLGASIGVGACSFAAVRFGSFLFTSDAAVQAVAKAAAPGVFYAVSTAIMAVTVDGAMLASRDFSFMLFMGLTTSILQLYTLNWCNSITTIFGTFTFRLASYTVGVIARVKLGKGEIGRAVQKKRANRAMQTATL
jgi:Na+-driven multidrug efflux pump